MKKGKPKTITEFMVQQENKTQPLREKLKAIEASLLTIRRRIDRIEQSIYGHVIQE